MIRLALLVLLAFRLACAGDADVILHNGKIVTVDPAFSLRQAISWKNSRITSIGMDGEVMKERGPKTEVIDLHGRTVLPGLIDNHVHALEAGLSEFRGPLAPLDSFEAIRSFIKEKASRTPKGEWVVVPRTFPTRIKELRMPAKDVLDVERDHPVLFDASYVVVVNSRALALCHITKDTPNPPGGEIVHDANGEPNGILRNAQSLLIGLKEEGEQFSEQEKRQALEEMLRRYLEAGLTSIADAAVNAEQIDLYQKLKASNRLPVRVVMVWRPDGSKPLEEIVQQIRNAPYHTGVGDGWLKFGALKVTVDGGMTIGTAYQRMPYGPFGKQLYAQTNPDSRGQLFQSPDKLLDIYSAAREKGWQLTAHAQGGGAIDAFLDAMAALDGKQAIAPTRSYFMHASFQSAEAIQRAHKLGVQADVQAPWLFLDAPALVKVFSYDAMRYFFPLRSYFDAGVVVAGGSDHMTGHDKNRAVNPYNPFLNMWIAVTRKTKSGDVFHPEERITRAEALRMYTTGAAFLQFAEKEKGSLEKGKLADLVVIDRDFLNCPEDEIRSIEPVMAVLNGKIAYRK